jgi:hypothetical protein
MSGVRSHPGQGLACGRIKEVRVEPRVTVAIFVCPVQAQLYVVGPGFKWLEEVAGTPWAGRKVLDFARVEVCYADQRNRGIEWFHTRKVIASRSALLGFTIEDQSASVLLCRS